MNLPQLLSLFLACLSLLFPASAPAGDAVEASDDVAVLETSAGTIILEFWPEVAPRTVENFQKLAREGFYDGTAFHRILRGFMAQGGDPLTKDPAQEALWGTGGPGYQIKAEFHDRPHERGVISMARSSDPDSAGSQFFLMFARAPHLDGQYTAFGKMVSGEETLAKIEATPTTFSSQGEPSKPTQRVELKSVRIVPRATALAPAGVATEGN